MVITLCVLCVSVCSVLVLPSRVRHPHCPCGRRALCERFVQHVDHRGNLVRDEFFTDLLGETVHRVVIRHIEIDFRSGLVHTDEPSVRYPREPFSTISASNSACSLGKISS